VNKWLCKVMRNHPVNREVRYKTPDGDIYCSISDVGDKDIEIMHHCENYGYAIDPKSNSSILSQHCRVPYDRIEKSDRYNIFFIVMEYYQWILAIKLDKIKYNLVYKHFQRDKK